MNKRLIGAGLAIGVSLGLAVAAQAQWSGQGWGLGYGGGSGLGRTEGPVAVDISQISGGVTVSVKVSGCGGVRDYRSFGSDIVDGDGQARDVVASLNRLLGEARRVCAFEERLAARIQDGVEPAFAEWLVEQTAMDMNMMDMNMADCTDANCNAM